MIRCEGARMMIGHTIGRVSRDLVSPVLVGRLSELGRLRGLLDRVVAGEPAVVLIAGEAGNAIVPIVIGIEEPVVTWIGTMLLWLSALLTIYTGWDYLQAGLHHLTREDA